MIPEMKEDDAMEPMLKHVKAVFAAERAARNTITNAFAGVDEQLRLQDALERAANARADATLSTKIWSCILSFAVAATQLCFVGPSLAWWSDCPPDMHSTKVYPCHDHRRQSLCLNGRMLVFNWDQPKPESFSLCRHQPKWDHAAPSRVQLTCNV
jgi:hypothetical protein